VFLFIVVAFAAGGFTFVAVSNDEALRTKHSGSYWKMWK